ncbi:phenylalanine--tRNA ligase subunit beta [Gammaproteobacteria bacterium]|nr:phenylalanine--tRNA ligase subunit beta [Gammaproteobacteria bacterium]
MKINYQDLLNFLSEKPSKEELSKKLFQLGHEHEINGDIFDMELTPNRGDCLSLIGLARDLAVFFGKSNSIELFDGDIEPLEINFENLSPNDCPKISFLEIEIEDSKVEYKPYLENYFNTIGGNKANLFTDISNYISYELGQPTHCFDAESIKTKLTFENKECNSTFKTLLNSEVTLKDRNCVFLTDDGIISLAGVMGGASTACSNKTKKVLVECAYFNPESIIGKSVKYNLISDAAHKFERGVDIASQEMILRRYIKVTQDHAKIKSIKLKSFTEGHKQSLTIPIDIDKINKILGTSLGRNEYLKHLKNLSFEIANEIKVPSFRHDIETNNDLAEEIARVIGYNNIKSVPINLSKITNDCNDNKVAKLESLLVDNGFTEVINFPFTSKKKKESINIDNPLDSSRSSFRTSLKDSLIDNLLYNERRQKESIKLFEISDIYTKNIEIKQQKKLGLIVSGRVGNNHNDFLKKLDNKYLNNLLITNLSEDIFQITEIHRNSLDTKKKNKIYYIETCLEDIPKSFFSDLRTYKKAINFVNYKPVSEYPSSTRDFSFLIDNLDKVNSVITLLDEVSDELIKDSFIFDFYKNDKTKIVKLGFRCIFQSNLNTLSDMEVNRKVKEILDPILKIESVSIPGM